MKWNTEQKGVDEKSYTLLAKQLELICEGEPHVMPTLSNAAALLWSAMDSVNWVGFYMRQGTDLLLGPFQGNVACIRIAWGNGVCGTAVQQARTVLVEDVHAFPGHIACDSASNSEIVIPIRKSGEVIGVLDVDSPVVGRFTLEDQEGLELFVSVLERICNWDEKQMWKSPNS